MAADLFGGEATLVATVADYLGNVAEARLQLGSPEDSEEGSDGEGDDAEASPEDLTNVSAGTDGSLAGQVMPSLPSPAVLPDQSFLSDNNVESINTANGNVNLSIPLGQVYSVGPHIKYQLRATHNSHAWDHATVACAHTNSGCQAVFGSTLVALPNRSANAGLGWEVHFGKLFQPTAPTGSGTLDRQTWPNRDPSIIDEGERWLYVSPDGASHHLFELGGRVTTHNGFPVRYSKDNSRIRMRQTSSTTVIVEHPNGVISQFEKTNSHLGTLICGNGTNGCWRFKEQRDYYGNKVWVTYSQSGNHEIWTIRDSTQSDPAHLLPAG